MKIQNSMTVYYDKGDAIKGERVSCQARKLKHKKLIPMTGAHRGTRIILDGNVFCVIEVRMMRID